MKIRYALASDLDRLIEIDNYYIANSNVTFDEKPNAREQKTAWFEKYKTTGPYRLLVVEESGIVFGCCYSSRYREHTAFDQTIETSIYLDPEFRGKGVGTLLYEKLFAEIASEGLHLAVVGIALPNDASVGLHKKLGFTEVGIFQEYAKKNGQFISSVWLQKRLS